MGKALQKIPTLTLLECYSLQYTEEEKHPLSLTCQSHKASTIQEMESLHFYSQNCTVSRHNWENNLDHAMGEADTQHFSFHNVEYKESKSNSL